MAIRQRVEAHSPDGILRKDIVIRCEKKRTVGRKQGQETAPEEPVSKRHIFWQVRCEHASQIRRNARKQSIFFVLVQGRKRVTSHG